MNKTFLNIITYFIAISLILFGIAHFAVPDPLLSFFPEFVPKSLAYFSIYASGLVELALGVGLVWPKYRALAANLSMWLFILYFPLHIRDLFVEKPIVGSFTNGIIRIGVQFLIIYLAWLIYSETKKRNKQ